MQFKEVTTNPESIRPEVFMQKYNVPYETAVGMSMQAASERIFRNATYQVSMSDPHPAGDWPPMIHLSILRLDGDPIANWDELQAVKNTLIGPEYEAIEIYPAESRLVNMGNNRHLWVFSEPYFRVPIGWQQRMVKGE